MTTRSLDRAEQAVLIKATAETDIENIKQRRIGLANYSVLASAAVVGAMTIHPNEPPLSFINLALFACHLNLVISVGLQVGLVRSIGISRHRLFVAAGTLAMDRDSAGQKLLGDAAILLALVSAPVLAWAMSIQLIVSLAVSKGTHAFLYIPLIN